jgi:hypothetical protein
MPRASKKKPAIDPDGVYLAWTSFAADDPRIVIGEGARLRGDHPAVQNHPWYFVRDGALWDEIEEARRNLYPEEAVLRQLPTYEPPPVLKDADAMVKKADILEQSLRVPRGDKDVKANPDAYVEVLAQGGDRDECLRATQKVSVNLGEPDEQIVWAGQLVPRDHPLVKMAPDVCEHPGWEPE